MDNPWQEVVDKMKNRTKEESIESLKRAGILDETGQLAEQYRHKETDHFGHLVQPNEPPDKEILVWEVTPHMQKSDCDYMVERSWQDMLAHVSDNLEYVLEKHDEEELMEGVSIKIKLVKMRKSDYEDIVDS